ncbi:Hypothetical predicted protein [Mytilus galloprovincialis]|uniref:Uncharacterized protein n=1 Tax=Mytilus galloprovincialis TaxID=29158 RepID=A0A8B6DAK0_MYTGA|nr:Hypothetical predicted protein [Mytilus galloprovincialis]
MYFIKRKDKVVWHQEEGGRSAARSGRRKMCCDKRKEKGRIKLCGTKRKAEVLRREAEGGRCVVIRGRRKVCGDKRKKEKGRRQVCLKRKMKELIPHPSTNYRV